MGGTQFKYQQISEFNFEFITKTNYVVFNHDFSLVFMIQQYSIGMLLSVLQFKSGILKSISRQRTYENQEQLLAFKNYNLFLKTCRYKGGILLNPITAQNNNKYLMRLKIKTRQDEISKTISCLIMNKNENLIVSGGHIFNGQKRAYIEFWSPQNGWRLIQQLNNSDIDNSNIKSISFNQSETKIITYVKIQYQYYIIIYQYEKSNQFLVEQSKFNMRFFNQFQYINDNILIVKQQRPKSNIFGNYRLQDVLASYVLNKLNGQFDQRMQIDDEESLGQTDYITLVYSPNKQILVSMSEGLLKLINIKDDGKLSIQQIINLELKYDYLSISQDLKYFVICQKQLMRIFQLVEE